MASKPIVCSTLWCVIRLKRAYTSVPMKPSHCCSFARASRRAGTSCAPGYVSATYCSTAVFSVSTDPSASLRVIAIHIAKNGWYALIDCRGSYLIMWSDPPATITPASIIERSGRNQRVRSGPNTGASAGPSK